MVHLMVIMKKIDSVVKSEEFEDIVKQMKKFKHLFKQYLNQQVFLKLNQYQMMMTPNKNN